MISRFPSIDARPLNSSSVAQAVAAIICLTAALLFASPVRGQGTANRAGLVIQHGDGTTFSTCVTFDEPSITGLELLRRAGVSIIIDSSSGLGAIVCAVDSEGCRYPDENCFCQCQGASCTYWVYWHLIEGEWQYSAIGAADWKVADGSVDGWVWGAGDVSGAEKPPATSFDAICIPEPTEPPPPTSTGPVGQAPAAATTPLPAQPTGTPRSAGAAAPGASRLRYLAFGAIILILAALIARQRRPAR